MAKNNAPAAPTTPSHPSYTLQKASAPGGAHKAARAPNAAGRRRPHAANPARRPRKAGRGAERRGKKPGTRRESREAAQIVRAAPERQREHELEALVVGLAQRAGGHVNDDQEHGAGAQRRTDDGQLKRTAFGDRHLRQKAAQCRGKHNASDGQPRKAAAPGFEKDKTG